MRSVKSWLGSHLVSECTADGDVSVASNGSTILRGVWVRSQPPQNALTVTTATVCIERFFFVQALMTCRM